MAARTPAAFERAARVYKLVRLRDFSARLEEWKRDPDAWAKFKADFNAAKPESALDEDLQPEFFDKLFEPGRFTVHVNAQEMAALSLSGSWGVFPLLLEMGWMFLRSEAPHYFVTSDDPCARVDRIGPTSISKDLLTPAPRLASRSPGPAVSWPAGDGRAWSGGWPDRQPWRR